MRTFSTAIKRRTRTAQRGALAALVATDDMSAAAIAKLIGIKSAEARAVLDYKNRRRRRRGKTRTAKPTRMRGSPAPVRRRAAQDDDTGDQQ